MVSKSQLINLFSDNLNNQSFIFLAQQIFFWKSKLVINHYCVLNIVLFLIQNRVLGEEANLLSNF